jgi:DNA polymerase sigma
MFLEFYGERFDYNRYALTFENSKPVFVEKSHLVAKGNSFACPSLLTIVDPNNSGEFYDKFIERIIVFRK